MLKDFSSRCPDETALIVSGKAMTWSALNTTVESIAPKLKEFEGYRLLVFMEGNSLDEIALLIALSSINVEAILVSPYHTKRRFMRLMNVFEGQFGIKMENGSPV